MKALLFPGQGSQAVGMGQEIYKKFEIVKKLFLEADDKLDFKISKIILEGPDSDLRLTKNTQPAILIVSYSIFEVLKKEFNYKIDNIKYFAGHSLGEYSALVCAGALEFSDAVFLLHERGLAMQEAVPVGEGGMLAILGLDIAQINNYIKEIRTKKICEIANDNADGQIIVSGNIESIDELQNILKKNKKKSIKLPVSAPFHCSLMNEAAEKMEKKINLINFIKPKIEIISNVTAKPETNQEKIKKLLVEQIYSKVRWRESIQYMANNGVNEFIEIGPGKVLSGMLKRIVKNVEAKSINSEEDIKSISNEPKK
jgi:[acyl-carrier-protein] S-malonyltransferase